MNRGKKYFVLFKKKYFIETIQNIYANFLGQEYW